ncbi:hypothetical protein RRG08_020934 [Elysia crispata]|uniref:Uncharacterized protein n=1 Tax=Elysia crispata TaxID=231223 RepID=A0AAE1A9R8_9GAST|nr:hypothetical protein RRG08_020934 [Elysia crispata]
MLFISPALFPLEPFTSEEHVLLHLSIQTGERNAISPKRNPKSTFTALLFLPIALLFHRYVGRVQSGRPKALKTRRKLDGFWEDALLSLDNRSQPRKSCDKGEGRPSSVSRKRFPFSTTTRKLQTGSHVIYEEDKPSLSDITFDSGQREI